MLNHAVMTEGWSQVLGPEATEVKTPILRLHWELAVIAALVAAVIVAVVVVGLLNAETLGLNAVTLGEQTVQGILPINPLTF